MTLTHFGEDGAARMVDVSAKSETQRVAVAEGTLTMAPETLARVLEVLAGTPKIYAQLVPILQPYTRVIETGEAASSTD